MTPEQVALAIDHRRLDEIHDCVVPACPQRARCAYYVHGPMRLAGRDWQRGDMVDLCPEHDLDLRRTADEAAALGYGGQFDKPEWPLQTQLALIGINEVSPLDRLREWRPAAPPA